MTRNPWHVEPVAIFAILPILFNVWSHFWGHLSVSDVEFVNGAIATIGAIIVRQSVVAPATINQAGLYVSDIKADAVKNKELGIPPVPPRPSGEELPPLPGGPKDPPPAA